MDPQPYQHTREIEDLYQQLWESWNARNARAFADLFTLDSDVIGFDGSQMSGREEIATTLQQIFTDHLTAAYYGKVRYTRFLTSEIVVSRAVVGMVQSGKSHIEPALNTIQTLIAVRNDTIWRIALLQNTPAQLHGRPELVQQLTEELQQVFDDRSSV